MAQFVKLANRWVNLNRVGAAEDDGTTVRLHADLDGGHGRISRGFTGEDAATLRGALNSCSVNIVTSATAASPRMSTEEIEDRG